MVLNRLKDLGRAATAQLTRCSRAHLNKVLSNRVTVISLNMCVHIPVVHCVESCHLIHTHRRHLQELGHEVHRADRKPIVVLLLRKVQERNDSRLLVLRRVARDDRVRHLVTLGRPRKRTRQVVHLRVAVNKEAVRAQSRRGCNSSHRVRARSMRRHAAEQRAGRLSQRSRHAWEILAGGWSTAAAELTPVSLLGHVIRPRRSLHLGAWTRYARSVRRSARSSLSLRHTRKCAVHVQHLYQMPPLMLRTRLSRDRRHCSSQNSDSGHMHTTAKPRASLGSGASRCVHTCRS